MSRRLASTLGGIMFIVTCTGAALAMPTAFTDEETSVLSELEQGAPQQFDAVVVEDGETTDVTTPTPTPTPTEDDAETDGADEGVENHGKAVSTAAHCAIKGRAHGELVRSVAQDKNATVASAQAACDAALAAAAAAPAGKPAKAPKAPKAPKAAPAAKPVKGPKPAKVTAPVVSETDETSESTEGSASPGHGGPPPGKGNPHKP